jgi:hypothetical protein
MSDFLGNPRPRPRPQLDQAGTLEMLATLFLVAFVVGAALCPARNIHSDRDCDSGEFCQVSGLCAATKVDFCATRFKEALAFCLHEAVEVEKGEAGKISKKPAV